MVFFEKMKLREKLVRAFKLGGIGKQIKTPSKTHMRYPTIHEVHIDKKREAIRYTFTLYDGTDPDLILNQVWVFKQVFGDNIEIKGKIKKFVLWVYSKNTSKSYPFNYEKFAEYAIESKLNLPIIAGMDNHGQFVLYDAIENPHMLVMGETGSGKSVYLRSVISFISIFMRNKIEIYLADMKRTEFFLFRNLDNVKCAVTDKDNLLIYLIKIEKELQRRGNLFDKSEVAHIDHYNALPTTKKKLPYMLLCIDEVALLKKEIKLMQIIESISCIGRALGCLMILSMQRGDAKVLEGQLKNNLTVRSVFRCADKTNSDIGLGRGSEENASDILKSEKGKFYCKMEETTLLQAPLLELDEAKSILEPFKRIVVMDEEDISNEIILQEEQSEKLPKNDIFGRLG